MSIFTMTELVQHLRAELDELTRRTSDRARIAPFRRIRDPRGDQIISVLQSADEQKQAAKCDEQTLARWSHTVRAVLRRRGASAEADKLAQLTAELTPLLLLDRQDRADVPESVWRRRFEGDLSRVSLALQVLLVDAAPAFQILQRRRAMDYASFPMRFVQVTPEQWTVQTERSTERITPPVVWNAETSSDLEAMVAAGRALYRAVFVGAVAEQYIAAGRQACDEGRGLRLELDLQSAGKLHSVPWELLHDGRQFVALARDRAVARLASVQEPGGAPAAVRPLRVLLTISSPRSLPWLGGERERQLIEAAVAPLTMLGLMELEVACDGSFNTLRRMLASASAAGRPFDGWHFIGHGEFDERAGRGTLAMTNDRREVHRVGGWELGTLFRNEPHLRFAVLNACEGARTLPETPMSGVATALIEAGVGRVVAMQFPISNEAAVVFAEELYGALADGVALDEAVAEARRGIFCRPNTGEWITPVVFMPAPGDGNNVACKEGERQK